MTRLLLSVAAVAALAACNSQPRLFEIAVDGTNLNTLPTSCYVGDTPPVVRVVQSEGIFAGMEWTVWDGPETQYLEMAAAGFGSFEIPIGDATPIELGHLIEGQDDVFTSTQQTIQVDNTVNPPISRVRTQVVKVTFDSMGATPEGKLDLTSNFDCAPGCQTDERNIPGNRSCTVALDFVGRELNYQREVEH